MLSTTVISTHQHRTVPTLPGTVPAQTHGNAHTQLQVEDKGAILTIDRVLQVHHRLSKDPMVVCFARMVPGVFRGALFLIFDVLLPRHGYLTTQNPAENVDFRSPHEIQLAWGPGLSPILDF